LGIWSFWCSPHHLSPIILKEESGTSFQGFGPLYQMNLGCPWLSPSTNWLQLVLTQIIDWFMQVCSWAYTNTLIPFDTQVHGIRKHALGYILVQFITTNHGLFYQGYWFKKNPKMTLATLIEMPVWTNQFWHHYF
jgi:hypothetical protein